MIMRFPALALVTTVLGMNLSSGVVAQREELVTLRTSEARVDAANPVIDLSMTSSVMSAPDAAIFSTGVETKALTAKDAISKNAAKMTAVVNQLKAAGIDQKDIQTSAIWLARDYIYPANGKRRFNGYRVSNTVTAKLRNMERLGELLDALTANGATEFSGPEFTLENARPAEAQARDKAWADAFDRARYHAKKAGFADVRVLRVAETVRQLQVVHAEYAAKEAMDAASAAADTPLEGGEIETSVSLQISFQMVR
jgi:hypothetical protein